MTAANVKTDAELEAQWAAEDAALAALVKEENRVAWVVKIHAEAEEQFRINDAVWNVHMSAHQNASDTMHETGGVIESPEWFDVYLGSLQCLLTDSEHVAAVEWFAARNVRG